VAKKKHILTELSPAFLISASRGDRKAQYELYRYCYPMLMAIGMRYCKDEQEAVAAVNQGFLKILDHTGHFLKGDAPFSAWARRVMINSVIDTFRQEKKWREVALPEQMPESIQNMSTDNAGEGHLEIEYLEDLLRRLPAATQQVFNLFAIDGYSHKEISASMGISEGTSKWHVNQARQQLQAWIKTEMYNGK
jgi:RNA polymerase sigma factor (sigma-70 family)